MHIHEEVLKTANEIACGRSDWTFGLEEVVRQVAHLNENSVRTHVVSRCCVNAPKNHLHKWDYFRRVSRGRYQILPAYREASQVSSASRRQSSKPAIKHQKAGNVPPHASLRDVIHAVIHKDDAAYIAECLEVAVVTQGDTLDEVTENLRQAVSLHLDGEDLASLRLAEHPRLQVVYDVSLAS